MDVPRSLPARVYLVAYDPQRHKLTRTSRLNHLVRTAALEELTISGLLQDEDGKVTSRGSVRREKRERIKELVALSGPAVPALKKVLSDEQAAAGAAGAAAV